MKLHQEVYDAGQEITSATAANLPESLVRILGRFLGEQFEVISGKVVDLEGNKTDTFASVVYAKSESAVAFELDAIPADDAAAIIEACENMDMEGFRAAYRRVAKAKSLKKSERLKLRGNQQATVTLGIIFALCSAVPLDELAEEIDRLNRITPSREWPDMVVVMSAGLINYAVQFPGESLCGDYFLPSEVSFSPPMYIVIAVRPTVDYSLNKMLSLLIAHLTISYPDAKLPSYDEIIEGVPQKVLTISGFQYNLSGDLLPVPRQFYNDRYLPPLPMRIEDQGGELLCTLQFLPWQDGGVILLRGKLPLDGLFVFFGKEVFERLQVFKRPDMQISSVLPITQNSFHEMLKTFQQRSNMIVRSDQTNWVVQKLADEGSQSPFMARLFIGMMRLVEAVYPDHAERGNFDKSHELVTSSLLNARTSVDKIVQLLENHSRRVTLGEIARIEGRTIYVDESIDKELRKEMESFLNTSVRTLKQGMQDLAGELQVNIGFLFKKQAAFEKGVASLESTDPILAAYLRETRVWSERLLESRNAIEHECWILPHVSYSRISSGINNVVEPSISDQPISEFVRFILDRLCCFVEEVTVHCLQRQLPQGITIAEIPLDKRSKEVPERFNLTVACAGQPAWQIVFHGSSFEET